MSCLQQQQRSGSSEGLGALLKGTSAVPTGRGSNRQHSGYKSDALTSSPRLPQHSLFDDHIKHDVGLKVEVAQDCKGYKKGIHVLFHTAWYYPRNVIYF
ncbi:hypothetical protein AALO_G00052650 [Alosa alosa]|uniref:Uncharacterized protein n=1 Tax=Alosa alosa TaxID=278164 RepID=A0AAV6H495_9TELE|nr:hypothetical protein AALO_G00052650 [Alosa alosa]